MKTYNITARVATCKVKKAYVPSYGPVNVPGPYKYFAKFNFTLRTNKKTSGWPFTEAIQNKAHKIADAKWPTKCWHVEILTVDVVKK